KIGEIAGIVGAAETAGHTQKAGGGDEKGHGLRDPGPLSGLTARVHFVHLRPSRISFLLRRCPLPPGGCVYTFSGKDYKGTRWKNQVGGSAGSDRIAGLGCAATWWPA